MEPNFGGEDQDIYDSFMDDLAEWEEKFLCLSNSLADHAINVKPLLEEVFRGVHSLKGGSAFIAGIDPRMGALTQYCHAYETFLHALRQGQIPPDGPMHELAYEGLVFLADGTRVLREGSVFPDFTAIADKYSKTQKKASETDQPSAVKMRSIGDMAEIVEEEGLLLIRLLRDVRYTVESRDLIQELSTLTTSVNPATRVAYHFGDRWRISSIVVGQIIASLPSFSEVAVLHGAHCELTWRRFRFRELGVFFYADLSAWRAARRMEASNAR